ncbi:cell division protein ZapA [Thermodesulfobacteriota bacterium]
MERTIRVKILDQEYLVKSEEEEDQVQKIAEYVSQKLGEVRENTEGLSEIRIAILAALHIANEYYQVSKERDDLLADRKKRTEALIYHIDSAMG